MVTHDPRAAEARAHLIHLDKGELTDSRPGGTDVLPQARPHATSSAHRLRSTLTIVGLVIAVLAFGLLQTVVRRVVRGLGRRLGDRGSSRATPSR